MATKTTEEVSQETDINSLLEELRSKLEAIGDKDCIATLDKLTEAVAAEEGEEETRPTVDTSMEGSDEEEAAETPEEEAAETPEKEGTEVEAGTEQPVKKGKYPVEQFDTEGM